MRTLAVLPVKSFGRAKQRLGEAVGPDERQSLARAMAGDVLEALGRVQGLEGVILVSAESFEAATAGSEGGRSGGFTPGSRGAEPGEASRSGRFTPGSRGAEPGEASRFAPPAGLVEVVHDPKEAGQSAAALLGIDAAVARGAERVLLVPGDCPALAPAEVTELLAEPREGLVIVPDRHGAGTNALLIAPPEAVEPAFGPGSFARHAALAHAAGVRVRVGRLPSLELDVDTPDDLAALRAALDGRSGSAPRTRALLDRLAAVHAG